MLSASEIRARINGVKDTKKITDAMYMISSAKMRKALRDLEHTTPYFEALTDKIGALFQCIPQTNDRYFRVKVSEDTVHLSHGIVLITSDKGLAGAYNQEAISVCEAYLKHHSRTTVFIIGEYGRQYFMKRGMPFVQDFNYSAAHPSLRDARRMCAELLGYYDRAELDEISIIYTDYMGNKPGECKKVTLLPLEKTKFHTERKSYELSEKEFSPSPDEVLDGVIPSYLMGFIYGSLVESYCSEQQARMNAMKSASENAEAMLKALKVQYNKIRQTAITGEMIEITAGAKAQRSKLAKAKGEPNI